ncbi:MAG: hypothetical protein KAS32_14985 [Candidatus Peribacteraceae bacterium]|nr:hypothetical protein [Candidatus Peribacteraceae bacterium]
MSRSDKIAKIIEDALSVHIGPNDLGYLINTRDKRVDEILALDSESNIEEEHGTHKDNWLQMIIDIAIDYDGNRTIEGLMGLVDELKAYARQGLNNAPYTQDSIESAETSEPMLPIEMEVECSCQNYTCDNWSVNCNKAYACLDITHGTEDCASCPLYDICKGTGKLTKLFMVIKRTKDEIGEDIPDAPWAEHYTPALRSDSDAVIAWMANKMKGNEFKLVEVEE